MMPKKFAEKTVVPVEKSRGEITTLLRNWGCDRIAWEDDFREGVIAVRFVWTKEGHAYAAKLAMSLPTEKQIRERKDVRDGRNGRINENKVKLALERNGRQEMRLLLLWLKAAFNAIDAGLLEPEVLFLPFFVNQEGETVAEYLVPRLSSLMDGTLKLLTR